MKSAMSSSSVASEASEGTSASSVSRESVYNLTFDKCPRCKIQFDFLKRVNVTKVPLILPCKHTVCEDCIRKLCFINNTLCPVCREGFSVTRAQIDSLAELFQPHFSIIGQLVWSKNSPLKREMNLVPAGFTLRNKHAGDTNDFDMDDTSEDGRESCDEATVSLVFEKCPEHNDQFLNISCEECGDIYCCYCFLENHAGHKASYLYKLTDSEKAHLEKLRMDAELILVQLLMSRRKVKELKTFEPTDVDQDIKNYFSSLHAQLHLAERNIRKRLTSMDAQETDMDVFTSILKSGIKKVKNLINHFNLLDSKQLNVRALLEEAQEVKELPCRLVSDQGLLRPIEFVSNNIFDNIEDQIAVKSMPGIEYNLVPVEDWAEAQEKYDFEQMRRQTETASQSEEKSPTLGAVKLLKHSENQVRKSKDGGTIRVKVTHINNLNSFYIQKLNSLDNLKDMNAVIGSRARRRDRSREDFKLGGTYGVAYETKNSVSWRRGKLLDIKFKDDKVYYKVFFLDYGNTQTVSREKLRAIDLYTIKRPPFAFECKLANPEDDVFDETAHLRLPQIIDKKDVYVRGLANGHRTQQVELLVTASNGGIISVKELLLLKTPTAVPETKQSLLLSELKLYKKSKEFIAGQEENVSVVYVENPHYMCIQTIGVDRVLEKMRIEMEAYYKNQPPINAIPVVDTDIVVRYKDAIQGNWHRAVITSVDMEAKEVDVHCLDWGKNLVVSWVNLRLLTEDFIKADSLGIIVRMADVQKLNSDEPWSVETVNFLRQQIDLNNQCRMVVSRLDPLEVALFQAGPSADLCLNSLLVEEGYALSTGKISETTYWPNVTDPAVEDDNDFAFQTVKKSEEVIMAEDDDVHLMSGIRLQVNVVEFKSPELIHIKFARSKDTEEQMDKELQIHYCAKKSPTKASWNLNERCVVFDRTRRAYFRAVIKSTLTDAIYLVSLYDHARELQVNKKQIFVQDPYFNRFASYVYKCKLHGIKPAGAAGGTWPQLAIELLEKVFAMHKTIYIKKTEMSPDIKVFGVIMWYCLTKPAKALEPAQVKYISINQLLLESGVAFSAAPSRNESCAAKENIVTKQNWYDLVCKDEETKEAESCEEVEEEEYQPTYQEEWLKLLKIRNREFSAILTCVDDDGNFYIRDEEINSCYQDLEKNLTSKLSSMQITPENTQWEEKDMCTIYYEKKWYRGTVIRVDGEDQVCVEMIDFGSTHLVSTKDLSRRLMYTDIPPFVFKVRLYDVHSKYVAWSADDVNQVLLIVTDNVNIAIQGDLDVDTPYAEIYLDNGLSLNNLLVQKCAHMSRNDAQNFDNDVVEAGILGKEETKVDNYTYICLPPSVNERKNLLVVSVLKWDTTYNVVLSANENLTALEGFITLTNDLQEQAASQPTLKKIQTNTPCACRQPQKKVWSRAIVYGISSLSFGFVLAFFVDYGTVEMVPATDLRQMRPEWFLFPVYMQIAAINIELLQERQCENVLTQINQLRGKWILVEIASESPLKVHLYKDTGELCYQKFVVAGVVQAL